MKPKTRSSKEWKLYLYRPT